MSSAVAEAGPGGMDTRKMMQYDNNKKSVGVAFALWFFLGLFGGHRFYLGKTGTGIVMVLLSITVVGLIVTAIWGIIDAFLIPGIVREKNEKLIALIG
ncbi:TM2 domain-containing protein [Belnapia moabensis]|uniref:TM2 domain-containing protein n=1 Tax=Belnapia moabensis TaxID=365533 RepID=UPI000694F1A0|nr:TM2 domain-containing protein [Belnapia moabensis]